MENEAPSSSSIQKVDDVQSLSAVLHPGLWNIFWLHLREDWFIMGCSYLACSVQLAGFPAILERVRE